MKHEELIEEVGRMGEMLEAHDGRMKSIETRGLLVSSANNVAMHGQLCDLSSCREITPSRERPIRSISKSTKGQIHTVRSMRARNKFESLR